jgi:neurotrimin
MLARVQRLSTWCLENITLFRHLHILYFQVAWIHIDRQMILTIHRHVISRVPRFSVSHDNAKTWLLHVSSVQKEDRGYYMCQVNTNPMISQVGYLQVVGKPTRLYF